MSEVPLQGEARAAALDRVGGLEGRVETVEAAGRRAVS